MALPLRNFLDAITDGLQKAVGGETEQERQTRQIRQTQQAVATLLYETARVDSNIKNEDLQVACECLRELFALSPEQARALLDQAAAPGQRPTSYLPMTKLVNERFSPHEKYRLVEYMWRVANADFEIDMYEDHLVRKIAELLYVPHRDFISAKLRARDSSNGDDSNQGGSE
ncbi:MAG: TerB family tellurite resistance protein [Burkholderiales bacterium]